MIKAIWIVAAVATLGNTVRSEISCPESSDDFLVFPDPENCAGYYECHQGFLIHLKCPVGFLWNQADEVCDLEENVICMSTPEPFPTTATPGPNLDCPNDITNIILYPDPQDCASFYECSAGNLTRYSCPGELQFNTDIYTCDYPDNVDCGDRNTPTPNSTPKPVTSTPRPSSTVTPGPDFYCPNDTVDIIFYPDPQNCAGFYECYAGDLTHYTCPGDLVFNTDLNTCDYRDDVDCGDRSTPRAPTSSSGRPTDSPYTNSPDLDCPAQTSEVIYYVDPEDCAKFYECFNGVISHMTCEEDHLWNPTVQYCDFIENVDCGDRSTHQPYGITPSI